MDESHCIYTEDERLSVCLQHCVRLPPYHNGSSFSGHGHRDTSNKVCIERVVFVWGGPATLCTSPASSVVMDTLSLNLTLVVTMF